MGDHYPLCEQYISGDGLPCICELLSQHADEMQAATRAELRAQMEALPRRGPYLWRSDVLTLFDGRSE